ncbi:aminomethyl-transferring glycine dehydrogenase subunit GcvPB [Caldisericum exile]|uniref:Probable glycine dehydrogenase (decarboxylating) subunit 2 n=1 Tax=Caldisericum exile (strain DSM 21853 / NBRC 104410 / AZM16c01) TaxID=511051 RepID=A0A7U6JEB6_CALEA|nr:aminomethyl-transferring glycine dehydrogenase subunit GcvPB [Caldisericum exile]BAL80556.1 glycine dehydrogenase [decarboxylating] subunit 2 [Caldisericum exile AZM16c01]
MKLIYEKSVKGRIGYSLRKDEFEGSIEDFIPEYALSKTKKELPEVSEVDVVRHFTRLSKLNYGVDDGFYPLGSCTMKYNPKVNEYLATLDNFTQAHPFAHIEFVQGNLRLMFELEEALKEITGMDRFTLMPSAGAHGELVGVLIMRKYFEDQGKPRSKMLIPDSAHGTNPASSAMAGFKVVEVKSNAVGNVDLDDLKAKMDEDTAGIMLTNPNTVGLFERQIQEIAEVVHSKGGLLYYDGANLNALLGIVRPGDAGFDVVHLNLHKTFSTPHGSGGPGAGAVGVKKNLVEFLPSPLVCNCGKYFGLEEPRKSIGRVKAFFGNFTVLVKAYAWILSMGPQGLKEVSETSIINANYVLAKLKKYYRPAYDRFCMHECVLTGRDYKEYGVKTLDIAKRLIDYGFHPPTIYFPHFEPYAQETIMVEPTESEGKETIDEFINVMIKISEEAKTNPQLLKEAPHITYVSRPDEVKANREPVLVYKEK